MKTLLRALSATSTTTVLAIALCGIVQEVVYRGIRRAIAEHDALAAVDAHRAMVDRSLAGEPV